MPRRTNPTNKPSMKAPPKQRKLHHPPSKTPQGAAKTASLPIHKQPFLSSERSVLESIALSLEGALADPNLAVKIQQIKALLYDKRFLEVFEKESWLDVYAARWVPSRALAFRQIFADVGLLERQEEIAEFVGGKGKGKAELTEELAAVTLSEKDDGPRSAQSVLCIGGGAGSELVAFAAIISEQLQVLLSTGQSTEGDEDDSEDERPEDEPLAESTLPEPTVSPLNVHLLDIGPYRPLIDRFRSTAVPRLVDQSPMNAIFHQTDVLNPGTAEPLLRRLLQPPNSSSPPIITLLFTLTELFLQSRPATIAFLRTLTRLAPRGSLFLVVDSANEEASAVNVGTEGRSWSLGTVLDGVLCTPPPPPKQAEDAEPVPKAKPMWKKLESEDSKWFRLREGLQEHYPVKLENTRYWLRLYRRN